MTPALEKLHRTLVPRRRRTRCEGAKIAPSTRTWVDLSGIETVFARFQLPDHRMYHRSAGRLLSNQLGAQLFPE
jgi:hypothetical protein